MKRVVNMTSRELEICRDASGVWLHWYENHVCLSAAHPTESQLQELILALVAATRGHLPDEKGGA